MSTLDKPSDGEEHASPNAPSEEKPIEDADASLDEISEQIPSEVALRINLLGRLVIPPSNP